MEGGSHMAPHQSGGARVAGGVLSPARHALSRRDAGEHSVLRGCRTLRARVLRWLPSWCLVSLLGSRREDRVPTRRGKTVAATLQRRLMICADRGVTRRYGRSSRAAVAAG